MKAVIHFFFFLIILPVTGQSLSEAVVSYITDNPRVRSAMNQVRQIEAGEKGELALLLPFDMDAAVNSTYSAAEGLDLNGNVSLSYTFFDMDKFAGRKKRDKLKTAALSYYQWVRTEVLYEALTTILKHEEAYESYLLKQNQLESVTRATEALEKRFVLRAVSQTELEYSKSRLAVAEAELIDSEINRDICSMNILKIFGQDLVNRDEKRIYVTLPVNTLTDDYDESRLKELRDDFKQSHYLIEAAQEQLEGSRRAYIPDLSLSTGAYDLGGGNPYMKFSLSSSIPLSSISFNSSQIQRFTLEKERAFLNLEILVRHSVQQLEEKRIILSGLNRKKEVYNKAVEYSRTALSGIQREFQAGSRSVYDLINGQNNYFTAIERLIKVEASYRYALLDFLFISGGLDINALQFSI